MGLRVRSQTPAEVKAISAKDSQACAADLAQRRVLWTSLSPVRGSIATLNPPVSFLTPPRRSPPETAGPEFYMSKELFVSSTPHEIKVGVVEDDLLAEIYLERENEYTLAGSIYKGRVTRVLPGMQSAFVDIGLERDAFLYVSDFMELAEAEKVDEIPTNRAFQEPADSDLQRDSHHHAETRPAITDFNANEKLADDSSRLANASALPGENATGHERNDQEGKDQGGFRGRRRRRGRRGERMPDSKFARTPSEG